MTGKHCIHYIHILSCGWAEWGAPVDHTYILSSFQCNLLTTVIWGNSACTLNCCMHAYARAHVEQKQQVFSRTSVGMLRSTRQLCYAAFFFVSLFSHIHIWKCRYHRKVYILNDKQFWVVVTLGERYGNMRWEWMLREERLWHQKGRLKDPRNKIVLLSAWFGLSSETSHLCHRCCSAHPTLRM